MSSAETFNQQAKRKLYSVGKTLFTFEFKQTQSIKIVRPKAKTLRYRDCNIYVVMDVHGMCQPKTNFCCKRHSHMQNENAQSLSAHLSPS